MPRIYENREVTHRAGAPGVTLSAPGPQVKLLDEVRIAGCAATPSVPMVSPSWAFSGNGCRMHSYFDIFYNTYHITPLAIDLGTLTGETQIPLSIWSAYLTPHTLNSISIVNDTGISVDLATPKTFAGLESVDTHITVSLEGPPAIDAHVLFSFDNGTPSVAVMGLRVVLLEVPPNWVQSVTDRLEYRTDIFKARDGHEQRRALRKYPRRTMRMRILAIKSRQHYFLRTLAKKFDLTLVIPDYVRHVLTAAPVAAADTTVVLDVAPEWALPGALVVLIAPDKTMQSGVLDAMDSGTKTATLHSPIGKDFPAGSKFALGLPGKLARQTPLSPRTGTVLEATLSLAVNPGGIKWWPRAWASEFDGRKVLDVNPNWRDTPGIRFQTFREDLDFGQGRIKSNTPVAYPERLFSATWTEIGMAKAKALEDFFVVHRGADKSFWLPSFVQDFMPMEGLTAGQHLLRIKGQEFYSDYVDSPVHKALRIRLANGTYVLQKITSLVTVSDPAGDDTHIVVNDPWANDVALADIVTCQWLYLARFAGDVFDMSWPVRGVGQAKLSFYALEAD